MDSISQSSLHDELLDRLRQMIIGGQFEPGDKIPERALCEQFGVSRTPLREALKVLAAEGLVRLAPNRGAVIAELSQEEFDECLPISAAIEDLSGKLACENITEAEMEEIKDLHKAMVAEHARGNLDGFVAATRQIHEKIVAASRNPLLTSIEDTLLFRLGWTQTISRLPQGAVAQLLADHELMLSALEARDGQRLSEHMRRYLSNIVGGNDNGDLGLPRASA